MHDYIALTVGRSTTRALAHSALPDAPVVAEPDHTHAPRSWTAARLRALAAHTYHLANRIDPARAATA